MAQLVARLNGIQKVRGSNPLSSTIKEKRTIYGVRIFYDMLVYKIVIPHRQDCGKYYSRLTYYYICGILHLGCVYVCIFSGNKS